MTCIAGLVDKGIIYMGGDSAGVNGRYDLRQQKNSKVFINENFLIGYTSSFRMGQLLQYKFNPPDLKEGQDLFSYMVTDFVEEVRNCLKQGGFARVENNEDTGGTFLVGYRGRLFEIQDDFQVAEMSVPYAAVGCGEAYALGSFYSTKEMMPEERVKKALEAAEMFSAGVSAPFNILQIGGGEK